MESGTKRIKQCRSFVAFDLTNIYGIWPHQFFRYFRPKFRKL